jgi:small ligand-binding sensory domain FIST
VAGHWTGGFDEAGLQQWARQLRDQLHQHVDLGLVFLTPQFFPAAQQILEILRIHAQIPVLMGCSGNHLIAQTEEIEADAGLVLSLCSLPGAQLDAMHFTQADLEASENTAPFWHAISGIDPAANNGWLVFADPYHLNVEGWLRQMNAAYLGHPVLGGLASGDHARQLCQVYLNGEVFEEGVVALSVAGEVTLTGVISQGCTPIGDTWTITKADRNFIIEIGNQPAYHVLARTYSELQAEEQKKARGNLFIGLAMNEYLEDFHRGDFLIRNLLGADPQSGVLSVGAFPRMGQTIQFQRRDAKAATEDLEILLQRARKQIGNRPIYGGCLCSCNGRGTGMFGIPNHDARLIQHRLGPMGLAGFFCNGEIGPVGQSNFLHGYTASLALFVSKTETPP